MNVKTGGTNSKLWVLKGSITQRVLRTFCTKVLISYIAKSR
jgi:hypothetical protein